MRSFQGFVSSILLVITTFSKCSMHFNLKNIDIRLLVLHVFRPFMELDSFILIADVTLETSFGLFTLLA